MHIRRALISDLPQLEAISQSDSFAAHWSHQQWLDIFHTQIPARFCWIAELTAECAGDEQSALIIGFLVAQSSPEWELENIAVLPAYRRRGAARALVSALLSEAHAAQAPRILLEVRASNLGAIHLYERSGFQLLTRRRRYYENPTEDALIFVHNPVRNPVHSTEK